jgi:hypothetical protein
MRGHGDPASNKHPTDRIETEREYVTKRPFSREKNSTRRENGGKKNIRFSVYA